MAKLCRKLKWLVFVWDTVYNNTIQGLGGAAVRRRTRDRKVAGSTPGRGAI